MRWIFVYASGSFTNNFVLHVVAGASCVSRLPCGVSTHSKRMTRCALITIITSCVSTFTGDAVQQRIAHKPRFTAQTTPVQCLAAWVSALPVTGRQRPARSLAHHAARAAACHPGREFLCFHLDGVLQFGREESRKPVQHGVHPGVRYHHRIKMDQAVKRIKPMHKHASKLRQS